MPSAFANFGMRAMPSAMPDIMRKILLATLLLLFLISCKKKYCWKCNTVTVTHTSSAGYINVPYTSDTTSNSFSECDKTSGEIKSYEKNTSSMRTVGNIVVYTAVTTTCDK